MRIPFTATVANASMLLQVAPPTSLVALRPAQTRGSDLTSGLTMPLLQL